MMARSVSLQLTFLHVLYLILCVFAIGKCQNRKLDCPRDLVNTPCTCKKSLDDDSLEVVCENADVDQIGILLEKIPKETIIKRMHLRGNQIIQLPGLKFQHLHIHHLFITSSGVHDIDPMAFFNLDNTLRSLDLSGNLLHKIPSDAIKRLKALRTLNLSSNLITRVSTNTFFGMTSLLNLHLENNQIEDVETFAFNGPDNLTKLHLNNNRIAKLPGRMFSQLPGLEEISLSHNSLVTFPEGFLQGVTSSLSRLDLNHNLFREIPSAIATLEKLEILNMNHNCLDDVARSAFEGPVSIALGALDLSSNNLTQFPVEAMTHVKYVSHLDLQNNSITEVPSHALKSLSLKYLYLQRNRISNVSVEAFHDVKHLEWLYLSGNKLTTLHARTFRAIKNSLKILDIHDNPLKCDCSLKWISQGQWPHLLTREKETKCREPKETFGSEVTRLSNFPQVCEAVPTEPSKLRQVGNHAAWPGIFGGNKAALLLSSTVFYVVCPLIVFLSA